MNKNDPRFMEQFVELVRAVVKDEFHDVPDERLRPAVQAALAEYPEDEDAWTDGVFTQGSARFFDAARRALRLQ